MAEEHEVFAKRSKWDKDFEYIQEKYKRLNEKYDDPIARRHPTLKLGRPGETPRYIHKISYSYYIRSKDTETGRVHYLKQDKMNSLKQTMESKEIYDEAETLLKTESEQSKRIKDIVFAEVNEEVNVLTAEELAARGKLTPDKNVTDSIIENSDEKIENVEYMIRQYRWVDGKEAGGSSGRVDSDMSVTEILERLKEGEVRSAENGVRGSGAFDPETQTGSIWRIEEHVRTVRKLNNEELGLDGE